MATTVTAVANKAIAKGSVRNSKETRIIPLIETATITTLAATAQYTVDVGPGNYDVCLQVHSGSVAGTTGALKLYQVMPVTQGNMLLMLGPFATATAATAITLAAATNTGGYIVGGFGAANVVPTSFPSDGKFMLQVNNDTVSAGVLSVNVVIADR